MQPLLSNVRGAVQSLTGRMHRHLEPARTGPIGIEFGHERLYMVQMDRDQGGSHIRGAASQPFATGRDALLANPSALKAALKGARSHRAFKGHRVVTCLPSDRLKLMLLNYECSSGGNEQSAVLEQAMSRVTGAAADWVVDYMPLRASEREGGSRTALVAMARRESVNEYLEMLRFAGLEVSALEINPVAIQRLVSAVQQERDVLQNILVVNLGRLKTYVTVSSGRRLILDRDMDFGEQMLVGKLAEVLDIDPGKASELLYRHGVSSASAPGAPDHFMGAGAAITDTASEILKPEFRRLAEEISKVLVYVASQSRGSSIDLIYLLGGIARWPGVDRQLGMLLELPVQVMQPLKQFQISELADIDAAEQIAGAGFAVAAGCALRGFDT